MRTKDFAYDVKRANNDINGNPRYIVHFLAFVNDEDREKADQLSEQTRPFKCPVSHLYDIALQKSRSIGGRKYTGKDFGGGIVFRSVYDLEGELLTKIMEIKQQ